MKLISAAIAPRQAVVEPKDCVSGLSRALPGGSWGEKRTFEFPILATRVGSRAAAWSPCPLRLQVRTGSGFSLEFRRQILALRSCDAGDPRGPGPWALGRLKCVGWGISGRLQLRPTGWRTWRRPGLQTQVRDDLLDHRLLEDRRDDL